MIISGRETSLVLSSIHESRMRSFMSISLEEVQVAYKNEDG